MKNKRYDIALIRDYLDGKLDAAAMYKLERAAQEDPLLMDLMEGMEQSKAEEHQDTLLTIDKYIEKRVDKKSTRLFPLWQVSSVAASLIFVLGLVFFFNRNDEHQPVGNTRQYNILKNKEDVAPSADTWPVAALKENVSLIAQNKRHVQKPQISSTDDIVEKSEQPAELDLPSKPTIDTSHLIAEVTIQGYATKKKSSISASVATVEAKDLENHNANLDGKASVLRGRLHGLSLATQPIYTGKIIDKTTKEPIIGASVKLSNTQYYTTSDVNGNFKLSLDEKALDTLKNKKVQVMMLGYKQEDFRLKQKDSLVIAMQPSGNALNELVVVGYGRNNFKEPKAAHPAMGWDAYTKYLKENAFSESGKKESVSIQLTVHPDGKLGEFKILKGNENRIKDAEDLVLNGPIWIGNKNGKSEIVKFKITFQE